MTRNHHHTLDHLHTCENPACDGYFTTCRSCVHLPVLGPVDVQEVLAREAEPVWA